MSGRDWLESGWHLALLLLVYKPVTWRLARSRNWRWLLGVAILAALGYHVLVVLGCHRNPYLCNAF